MDVERTIEFLLNNQAKHDERLTRLETIVVSLAAASRGSRASSRSSSDNVERLDGVMVTLAENAVQTNRRIDQLAESGAQADRRIDQLGTRVDQLVSAVGAMIRQQPPPQGVQ